MKRLSLFIAATSMCAIGYSQSVGVGTTNPSANAALEVTQGVNPQGVLIPKMNTTDMNTLDALLAAGDEGMLIYNTDSAGFMYWDGVDFVNIAPSASGSTDTDWTETGNYVISSDSIGIGVTSPASELEVDGKVLTDSLRVLGEAYFGDDITANNNLRVYNDIFVLNDGWATVSGNVVADTVIIDGVKANGVYGTAGQVLTSGGPGFPAIWSNGSGDNLGNHTATANVLLNDNYLSNDGGNEGIRIANDGNVAMGSTPTGKELLIYRDGEDVSLRIEAESGDWDAILELYINAADLWSVAVDDSDGDKFKISDGSPGINDRFVIDQNGYVIVNGEASAPADGALVNSQWCIWLDEANNEFELKGKKSDGTVITGTIGSGDTDWTESGNYVINMSDSVGIGVAVPLADLDVAGRIKADSLTVNGVSYFGGGMSIAGAYDPAFALRVYGKFKSAGLTETSDERLKEDVETVKNALEAVMQLRGVTYHWIDREQDPNLQIGLIAQELESVYPELVDTDSEGFKSVQYSKLVAVLIEAMKEQQEQINELKNQVEELNTLKAEVEAIKAHVFGTSVTK